jgi:uncharacterized Tic20 family protein
MSDARQPVSTSDDRIMAALAHGAMILGLWGVVISAVIWGTQKEKSTFVRFQALQAMVYQICDTAAMMLLGLLVGFCGFGFFALAMFGGLLTMSATTDPSNTPAPFIVFNVFFPLGIVCLALPLLLIRLALIAYAFYGAYQAYQGRDFRYIGIGPRVERYLAQSRP